MPYGQEFDMLCTKTCLRTYEHTDGKIAISFVIYLIQYYTIVLLIVIPLTPIPAISLQAEKHLKRQCSNSRQRAPSGGIKIAMYGIKECVS